MRDLTRENIECPDSYVRVKYNNGEICLPEPEQTGRDVRIFIDGCLVGFGVCGIAARILYNRAQNRKK